MRPTVWMTCLWLMPGGCADTKDARQEGENEDDPDSPYDTASDSGSDGTTDEPFVWSELPADPADHDACYLGRDGAGTTCLPTVQWSAEWGHYYDYPPPLDGDPQYEAPARYLDLSAAENDPDLYVAPNFQLGELVQERKGRFGVFQTTTVVRLQDLRDLIGGPLYINSAYRNVDYNAGVGGATWSRHQYGDAVDIRSDDATLEELADMCADLGAGFTSIYTSHVHCDWRDDPLDPAFFDVAGAAAASDTPLHAPLSHHVEVERLADGTLRVIPFGFDEGQPLVRWTVRDRVGRFATEHAGETLPAPRAGTHILVDVGGVVQVSVRP